jgi:hypothetical protein
MSEKSLPETFREARMRFNEVNSHRKRDSVSDRVLASVLVDDIKYLVFIPEELYRGSSPIKITD